MSWSLPSLLAPTCPERFWAEHYERAPLYVPASDPHRFEGLLSIDVVEGLLAGPGLTHEACRMARDTHRLTRAELAAGWVPAPQRERDTAELDPAKVHAAYRSGATLILDAHHRRHPPLAALVRGLEQSLSHPLQVNVYLTPPESRGFGQHYDSHDVFILHLEGRKRWRLFDRPVPFPTALGQDTDALRAGRRCVRELVLQPGDFLYVPRGHLHETVALDGAPSLHLTVGLLTRTWLRALDVARELAQDRPALRRGIPPGFIDDPAGFAEGWRAALAELSQISVEALHNRLSQRFVRSRRPLARRPLGQNQPVEADDHVRCLPGLVWRIAPRGETIRLEFLSKRLDLPSFTETTVRHLLAGPSVRIGDLEGSLDGPGCLTLARRLMREGAIEPAVQERP